LILLVAALHLDWSTADLFASVIVVVLASCRWFLILVLFNLRESVSFSLSSFVLLDILNALLHKLLMLLKQLLFESFCVLLEVLLDSAHLTEDV